jgi:hypothetical protein
VLQVVLSLLAAKPSLHWQWKPWQLLLEITDEQSISTEQLSAIFPVNNNNAEFKQTAAESKTVVRRTVS